MMAKLVPLFEFLIFHKTPSLSKSIDSTRRSLFRYVRLSFPFRPTIHSAATVIKIPP